MPRIFRLVRTPLQVRKWAHRSSVLCVRARVWAGGGGVCVPAGLRGAAGLLVDSCCEASLPEKLRELHRNPHATLKTRRHSAGALWWGQRMSLRKPRLSVRWIVGGLFVRWSGRVAQRYRTCAWRAGDNAHGTRGGSDHSVAGVQATTKSPNWCALVRSGAHRSLCGQPPPPPPAPLPGVAGTSSSPTFCPRVCGGLHSYRVLHCGSNATVCVRTAALFRGSGVGTTSGPGNKPCPRCLTTDGFDGTRPPLCSAPDRMANNALTQGNTTRLPSATLGPAQPPREYLSAAHAEHHPQVRRGRLRLLRQSRKCVPEPIAAVRLLRDSRVGGRRGLKAKGADGGAGAWGPCSTAAAFPRVRPVPGPRVQVPVGGLRPVRYPPPDTDHPTTETTKKRGNGGERGEAGKRRRAHGSETRHNKTMQRSNADQRRQTMLRRVSLIGKIWGRAGDGTIAADISIDPL